MKDKPFYHTIQYLDNLHEEGILDGEKTEKLARFSLDIGASSPKSARPRKPQAPKYFIPPEETNEILSDVLQKEWPVV